jgi:hypothetical protein
VQEERTATYTDENESSLYSRLVASLESRKTRVTLEPSVD